MSNKLDDYLGLEVRDYGCGVTIKRTFTLEVTEIFSKKEYIRFQEEIKHRLRTEILHELMKLVAQEIEENGIGLRKTADEALLRIKEAVEQNEEEQIGLQVAGENGE